MRRKADWELDLDEILPEYESKNFFVRSLFWKRLNIAENMLLSRRKTLSTMNIVDLGTGPAILQRRLMRRFPKSMVCGVDYNFSIKKIKGRKALNLLIGDARFLSFKKNSLDAVFMLDVLEHIPDLKAVLAELDRVLKDDGLVIISVPTETAVYKLGRLLLKGTTDQIDRPGGKHYHEAKKIIGLMKQRFSLIELKRIPLPWPFTLFNIACFGKRKK
jgi:ubiquinone/menaquinone biosynthesis C-methylase UbiE